MSWVLGRRSKLSLENKTLTYKSILKPIRTYGIQLWGCAKPSNIKIIQRLQSKILRSITNAPWYVSNLTLHKALQIPFISEEIKKTFYYIPQPTNRTYKQLHSKSKQPIKHQSKTTTNMAFRAERTQRWRRVVVPTNITHSTYRRIITGWSLRTRSPCNTFAHCSIVE
jgi:hypothetical protein